MAVGALLSACQAEDLYGVPETSGPTTQTTATESGMTDPTGEGSGSTGSGGETDETGSTTGGSGSSGSDTGTGSTSISPDYGVPSTGSTSLAPEYGLPSTSGG